MKVIVIGPSLAGKTTLIEFLRSKSELPFSEVDEELTRLNNGQYPTDYKYKQEVLTPKVIGEILNRENIVFFTNTNYFSVDELKRAKKVGFKIVQLELSLDELMRRNEKRINDEGYEDMGQWLEGMLEYQAGIRKANLVDKVINAAQTTETIGNELINFVNK